MPVAADDENEHDELAVERVGRAAQVVAHCAIGVRHGGILPICAVIKRRKKKRGGKKIQDRDAITWTA